MYFRKMGWRRWLNFGLGLKLGKVYFLSNFLFVYTNRNTILTKKQKHEIIKEMRNNGSMNALYVLKN